MILSEKFFHPTMRAPQTAHPSRYVARCLGVSIRFLFWYYFIRFVESCRILLACFLSFMVVFRVCFLFVYILLLQCTHFVWYNGDMNRKESRPREFRRFPPRAKPTMHHERMDTAMTTMHMNAAHTLTCNIDLGAYASLFAYAPLDDATCAITGCTLSDMAALVLPAHAPDGRAVVAIGDRAFEGREALRSVTLPDSVERIGRRAFAFCTGLLDIRTGVDSRLSTIGDRAFIGCERLRVLRFGHLLSLTSLGRHAFAHCTHLVSAVLPEGMTELSPSLFEGCTALLHLRLPASLCTIRTAALAACSSLTTLALPSSVRSIEDCAFAFCGRLTDLHLPESACVIASTAFMDCVKLGDVLRVG